MSVERSDRIPALSVRNRYPAWQSARARCAATARSWSVGVRTLCVLTVIAACPPLAAEPVKLSAGDLRVDAEAVGPGVFAVHVHPIEAVPSDAPRDAGEQIVSGDGAVFALQVEGSAVHVRLRPLQLTTDALTAEIAAPRVAATLRPLAAYGRARVPGLELSWNASPGEALYGLGQRFNGLDQSGRRVEMWIKDSPGAGADQADSYFCAPVVYSSRNYAIWADDNPDGEFELARVTAADASVADAPAEGASGQSPRHVYRRAGRLVTYYFALGDSLRTLVTARTKVRGGLRPIPDWALGVWISRNSYEVQAEAVEAIEGMLRRGWPVAAIVQEAWKGLSERGDFNNFSPQRWPDLDAYFDLCRRHDIKTILWQVPITHPLSPEYAAAAERGYFVRDPSGAVSQREAWLAGFANVDFTNPQAARWWKDQMRDEVRRGVWGFKADDGEDIKPTDVLADGRRGWAVHNDYSVLYNRALWELLDEEGVDGLLWCRSGSVGIERTPALWAGDQLCTWPQLRSLVGAGLSAGLSGMPYWSHDIGGYAGTPAPELYIRWMQFGAFSPLMQFHGATPREPWYFGQRAEAAADLLIHLRMILLPTLRALAREAAETGVPLMRPMVLEFPDDERFVREDSQFMLGPDLLVAPVFEPGVGSRRVTFPAGAWHMLTAPVVYDGPGEWDVPCPLVGAPVFVRQGATLALALPAGVELTDPRPRWKPDSPTVRVTFGPKRARIRNLAVPAIGNALLDCATIRFEPCDADTTWRVTHGSSAVEAQGAADTRRDGRRVAATLRRGQRGTTPTDEAGEPAWFEVAEVGEGDVARVVYRGELRWRMPLSLEVERPAQWLVDVGGREIVTHVRSHADEPIAFQLHARADGGVVLPDDLRMATAPAGGTVRWTWPLHVQNSAAIESLRVEFELMADDLELDSGIVALARPMPWVVCGPFPAESGAAAYATAWGPETEHGADVAFETRSGNRLRWQQVDPEHVLAHNGLNLGALFDGASHAAAYALTKLNSLNESDAELRFGSDDTLTVWLNGQRVLSREVYRAAEPDQEVVPVRIRPGENVVVVKVAQGVGDWRLLVRLTGPGDRWIEGVQSGFADWKDYAPDRPPAARVIPSPPPSR